MKRGFTIATLVLSTLLIFSIVWWASTNSYDAVGIAEINNKSSHNESLKCLPRELNITQFLGERWINYTEKRLYLARRSDGGFTEIVDTITPNIISTYYFLSTLSLINESPSNLNQTKAWLVSVEEEILNRTIKEGTASSFARLHYWVLSMKMVNLTPSDSDRIISFVLSIKSDNGTFFYGGEDVTYLAIKVLYYLGYNMTLLHSTANYYIHELDRLSLQRDDYNNLQYLLEVNIRLKALSMLGISYVNLTSYRQIVTYVRSSYESIKMEISRSPPIFYVSEGIEFLAREGLLTSDLSSIAYEYTLAQKLPDGGYHIWNMNYGEPQGTYHAVRIIVLTGHTPDKDTLQFIHSWESPLGGFALPFYAQGDPYATYMAVYVMNFLGIDSDKDRIKHFLEHAIYDRSPYSPDDPSPLYVIYRTYDLLEIQPSEQDREYIKSEVERMFRLYLENRKNSLLSDPGWIYLIRLGKEVGIVIGEQTKVTLIKEILKMRNPDGSFGNITNVTFTTFQNTVQAVILLHELEYEYDDDSTLQYILEFQHDGGWGAPDLYNTLLAVQALVYLKHCPQDIEGLLELIGSLKYPYGGFRLYSRDISYGGLQETYFALKILELLGAT